VKFIKDPDVRLEIAFHFRRWLKGRTLTGVTATVVRTRGAGSTPLTVAAIDVASPDAIVTVSGGALGEYWDVTAHGTASDAETTDKTISLRLRAK
jgi:hypothetical protein